MPSVLTVLGIFIVILCVVQPSSSQSLSSSPSFSFSQHTRSNSESTSISRSIFPTPTSAPTTSSSLLPVGPPQQVSNTCPLRLERLCPTVNITNPGNLKFVKYTAFYALSGTIGFIAVPIPPGKNRVVIPGLTAGATYNFYIVGFTINNVQGTSAVLTATLQPPDAKINITRDIAPQCFIQQDARNGRNGILCTWSPAQVTPVNIHAKCRCIDKTSITTAQRHEKNRVIARKIPGASLQIYFPIHRIKNEVCNIRIQAFYQRPFRLRSGRLHVFHINV